MKESKWKILDTRELFKTRFFRFKAERCELPDGKIMPNYFTLEFPDWVNVLPITADGKVILIKQYRHANRQFTIEIPGGSMHPTEQELSIHEHSTEKIQEEAQRELLEETGYDSNRWIYVGYTYPNPALQSNRMHTFLALDAKKTAEQNLDPFEDIEVIESTPEETKRMVLDGRINHSLIATSILLALEKLKCL